jgi:hypothetical protein
MDGRDEGRDSSSDILDTAVVALWGKRSEVT